MANWARWVVSLALALAVAGASVAVGTDPTPRLEPTADGWRVTGFAVESTRGEVDRLDRSAVGSAMIEVEPGGRRYLTDPEGRSLGFVTGPVTSFDLDGTGDPYDGVQPLSVIVDRDSSELVLAWRPVPGADLYEVSIGERRLTSTSATSVRIPLDEVAVDDLVDVTAIDRNAPEEERIIGTMSLVVSEFVLGRIADPPGGPIGRLPVPPRRDLMSVGPMSARPNDTHFRFKTFIPERWVSAPIICNGEAGFSTDRYFRGDDRTWSATSTRYRTLADVSLYWESSDTTRRYVGLSKLYRKNPNGTYTLLARKSASQRGITFYGPNTYRGNRKNFIVYHRVGNPFCPRGIGVIDYRVSVVGDRVAGFNAFRTWGVHDRAPNYEFYYRDNTIGWRRFRAWNRGPFRCLTICTQTSFSVVK